MPPHAQDESHAASLRDPESFWSSQAEQLFWHKKPSRALQTSTRRLANGIEHPTHTWFPGGEISTTYNCVDRHVAGGNGDSVAIIWDSPVTGNKAKYTYRQLLGEVEALAGVLREEGVKKGDVVLVYSTVCSRIEASKPRAVMTASCGIEGAKAPISYKLFVEGALVKSNFKPERIIVWQREQLRWDPIDRNKGERHWQKLVEGAKRRGIRAEAVPVKSDDGLYIIYTSGTTGLPKGVLREAGGHAVGLNLSIRFLFGIKGPGDTIFCASDIGWVVGHSYILYAPLLAGASTVLFEGKPVGTPNAGTFWRLLSEYKVNVLFTAPTALRAIRRADPSNKFFSEAGQKGDLKHLRALFLAGERSEPSIIHTYQTLLSTHCAPNALVIDNWWSSESGSPITGIALHPSPSPFLTPLPPRPGSAGKPLPGFSIHILSSTGTPLPPGTMGNIVLLPPLAPTAFTTLFHDPLRFYTGYLARFPGYVDTGDAGMIDEGGYVHVMARSDDILNVAAHRFSTAAIEQAIASHPSVAECCVVGMPHELKGQVPFAFVVLSSSSAGDGDEDLLAAIQARIREQIGPIAALGGMLQGKEGMIPRTRSGKTLRRVLRELVENAVRGEFEREVQVPATVEDAEVVQVARGRVRGYFEGRGLRAKL
ncbi:MAG: hypothetical protein Q9195_008119 [Heterodermia aff. obscurata]